MAHPAIARGDRDVFELYVHVVLSYKIDRKIISVGSRGPESTEKRIERGMAWGLGKDRTFDQFAPVHLARCDLKRYDMVLWAHQHFWKILQARVCGILSHTWASFSSFMGIPMVLVILKVDAQGGNNRLKLRTESSELITLRDLNEMRMRLKANICGRQVARRR